MRIISQVSNEFMIAAFLRAEMSSSRFRHRIDAVVPPHDPRLAWLCSPDLDDPEQCKFRDTVLGHTRGWRTQRSDSLLASLPSDTQWMLTEVSLSELLQVRFIREGAWVRHTDGRRTVAAMHEFAPPESPLLALSELIPMQAYENPMIAVGQGMDDLVMLEGNGRLSAAEKSGRDHFQLIVGLSSRMHSWKWW